MNKTIYTIGHSTHPIDEFIKILKAFGIETVVDVRTIPKSRYVPQFNSENLDKTLGEHDIGYVHLPELGGLRHAKKDSINIGWKNLSFRGFADYMQTAEFKKGIQELLKLATKRRVTIMCAEAVPWRCHRSLIGDALIKHHWAVLDIMSLKNAPRHSLTPFLKVRRGELIYPKLKI